MLYSLLEYLGTHFDLPGAGLFRYLSFRSVCAIVFALLIGAIFGNIVVFLIISIVGNALNFALNLLGCFVHDLRLQCLEYFGKFYKDGGKPFRPLEINTKFVNVATTDK